MTSKKSFYWENYWLFSGLLVLFLGLIGSAYVGMSVPTPEGPVTEQMARNHQTFKTCARKYTACIGGFVVQEVGDLKFSVHQIDYRNSGSNHMTFDMLVIDMWSIHSDNRGFYNKVVIMPDDPNWASWAVKYARQFVNDPTPKK